MGQAGSETPISPPETAGLSSASAGSRPIRAVGHRVLVIIYHVLRRGALYHDLGFLYFEEFNRQTFERRLTRRLERLGSRVTRESTTEHLDGT